MDVDFSSPLTSRKRKDLVARFGPSDLHRDFRLPEIPESSTPETSTLSLTSSLSLTSMSLTSTQSLPSTQSLDELSPLHGAFSQSYRRRSLRLREWDYDGHGKDVHTPLDKFAVRKWKLSCPGGRPGFQRLVYQKARYLREEKGHGNGYAGFQQVGRDIVRSVRVCMQIAHNLQKRKEPMHIEQANGFQSLLDGADDDGLPPKRDSINKKLNFEEILLDGADDGSELPPKDDSAYSRDGWMERCADRIPERWTDRVTTEETGADDGWKDVFADLKLLSRILSFVD
jgi:hypothetical protein